MSEIAKKITFGTDGWRAVIADQFTFDNVRACAQGVADYLKQSGQQDGPVVIGYDTRFASDEFAAASAEVLAANGVKVWLLCKTAPTPVVSYTVKATKSAGGIVITASHNPGKWNGFKYKDSEGASAPTEIITEVEKNTNEALASGKIFKTGLDECIKKGQVVVHDPFPDYVAQLRRLLDLSPIQKAKFKIIVDSMYGAGMGYFKTILSGGKLSITEIHGEPNPIFPGMQPEPIDRNLTELLKKVPENKADIGLATDGDSDRIGIVTEKGDFLNPHQVFALLALYFIEIHNERRPIVRSLCSTNMLDKLGKKYNIPVYITKVGFKYVAPVMLEKDAFIGGEESGGYGFSGHVPERDGILAGLYFLDYMIKTGKTPSQLLRHLYDIVGEHYYHRYDFHITEEQHRQTMQNMAGKVVDRVAGVKVDHVETVDGYKYILSDDSWLLIRFSGTEPLIRIYAESHSMDEVKKLLEAGKEIVGI